MTAKISQEINYITGRGYNLKKTSVFEEWMQTLIGLGSNDRTTPAISVILCSVKHREKDKNHQMKQEL